MFWDTQKALLVVPVDFAMGQKNPRDERRRVELSVYAVEFLDNSMPGRDRVQITQICIWRVAPRLRNLV